MLTKSARPLLTQSRRYERPFLGNSVEKLAIDFGGPLIRRSTSACFYWMFVPVARSKRRFGERRTFLGRTWRVF